MPKPKDRVQLQKQEREDLGGSADDFDDFLLSPLNPDEDAPEVGGIFFQSSGVRDSTVTIYRESSQMWFEDVSHSGVHRVNLDTLLNQVSPEEHQRLRHGIHFIDSGPAEGFASGAVKVTQYQSAIFPTSEIWYESDAQTDKIFEKLTTYQGILEDTITYKIHSAGGSGVLATIVDDIEYDGIFETKRTRTITL